VLREGLIVKPVKHLPVFMTFESSLPCFFRIRHGPSPELHESTPCPHNLFVLRSVLILSIDLHLGLASSFYPSGFRRAKSIIKSIKVLSRYSE
jgi:hypothetical protein